jgi:hypothetical protein
VPGRSVQRFVVLVPNIGLHAHANIFYTFDTGRSLYNRVPFSVLQRAVQRFVYIAINAAFSDLAIQFGESCLNSAL